MYCISCSSYNYVLLNWRFNITVFRIGDIAKLCEKYDIPHIINNAYGVQAPRCMNLISEADRLGRVDAFIQSTDKNFLVPVGGAVVASSNSEFVTQVSQAYPGD